jgi:glycosyltransferase involved in cell wall biosynthesis
MNVRVLSAVGASPRRLAVVISHPIQHFAPLFRDLAKHPEIELKVFYCCDWGIRDYADPGFGQTIKWDIPLLEGYQSEFLPIKSRPKDLSFFSIDNPGLSKRLNEFSPDAVWVHGYGHRTSWRAIWWATLHRKQVLYFGDSELLSPRGRASRTLKRLVLPFFFSRCHSFLTIGDQNEAYYRHYGVPESRMFRGAFPVDVQRFRRAVQGISSEQRRAMKARYGLHPNAFVVLFVGKLISIKRPLDVVKAVDVLRDRLPHLQALMLGSGPLEKNVREEIERLGLQGRVVLPGFINQSEMPVALSLGDCLAMVSEKDPHPLAVTESMAVGNAVVASDRVGCVGPTDSARMGENAIVYPCGDIDQLANAIERLATDKDLLARFQNRSVELSFSQDSSIMVIAVLAALGVVRLTEQPTGTLR